MVHPLIDGHPSK